MFTDQQSTCGKCTILWVAVLGIFIGLFSADTEAACNNCRFWKKPLPGPSMYWESKLGRTVLTQGPTVEVTLPGDAPSLKEAAVLARYAGARLQIGSRDRPIRTRMTQPAAKALLAQGIPLTILPNDPPLLDPKTKATNDTCADAIPADVNETYVGTTAGATEADVWYVLFPTKPGDYRISLADSAFDTTLDVYDECGGTIIASDDDSGPGLTSELTLSLSSDRPYYIRISGFAGGTGEYTLRVTLRILGPGAACHNALAIDINEVQAGFTDKDNPVAWYTHQADQDGFLRFSTEGSDFDTVLQVHNQCGGEVLAANDDAGEENTSLLMLPVVTGQTYYIRVSGYSDGVGNYQLSITEYVPQPGEFREVAVPMVADTDYSGDTGEMMEGRAWYRYTAPTTSPVAISLLGSDFDTILIVRDEQDVFLLGYNDDSADLQSRLSMDMSEGSTYLIIVAGFEGEEGAYTLHLTPVTRPDHDAVASPQTLTLGVSALGSTDGATSSLDMSMCSQDDSRDVWYSLRSPLTSFIKIGVETDDFDPTLSLFDAEQGLELACCDDDNCSTNSTVYSQVTEGTEYLIRVAGYNGTTGNFTLNAGSLVSEIPEIPSAPVPAHESQVTVSSNLTLSWNHWPTTTETSAVPQVTLPGAGGFTLFVVYGYDDRREEYEVTDPQTLRAGDATVVLVEKSSLQLDADGQTYRLTGPPLHEWVDGLCSDEPYYDQPTPGFCSGFLVGPDLIATAGHCTGCDTDLADIAVVFGFVMADTETPVLTVPVEEVYSCRELVASQNGDPDWGLIRLDRLVTDHRPLPIRQAGRLVEGQSLMVIGHPVGLPRKYDRGGRVKDNWQGNHFGANLDTYGGNSGSAVLNADTLAVEGILVWGLEDFNYDDQADCTRSLTCPDTGCPGWERATRISLLRGLVPNHELWMGTNPDTLTMIQNDSSVPEYTVSDLIPGQYYWRIRTKSAGGQVWGPVWSFSVQP